MLAYLSSVVVHHGPFPCIRSRTAPIVIPSALFVRLCEADTGVEFITIFGSEFVFCKYRTYPNSKTRKRYMFHS